MPASPQLRKELGPLILAHWNRGKSPKMNLDQWEARHNVDCPSHTDIAIHNFEDGWIENHWSCEAHIKRLVEETHNWSKAEKRDKRRYEKDLSTMRKREKEIMVQLAKYRDADGLGAETAQAMECLLEALESYEARR